MPARTMRNRPLSDPTLPMMQLQPEVGNPSEEDFVNQVGDVFGSQHVRLYGANGQPLTALPAGHDITGIGDGRKIVTTASIAVSLVSTPTPAKIVIITAETDNTGYIVVGGVNVTANLAARRGTPLVAGDSVTLYVDNLADVYIDSTVNGDGVTFTYMV